MSETNIDTEKFWKGFMKIRQNIHNPLCIILGNKSDLQQVNLNGSLCNLLFGYEFPNTIIVIHDQCKIFTSKKKIEKFKVLQNVELNILEKDSDLSFLSQIPNLCGIDLKNLKGNFKFLNKIQLHDITDEILRAFLYKDDEEIEICTKGNLITNHVLRNCIEYVREDTFDGEKLEGILDSPIQGIDNSLVEYTFEPEISKYLFRLGFRYLGYCVEFGRTVFRDLNIVYNAQKFILGLIRLEMSSVVVYNQAWEYLKANDLLVNENFLYTTGLLDEELSFKEEFIVKKGLVFVLRFVNSEYILSNTFYMDEAPVFITPNDKYEDYLDNRPRFRNKQKEHELDLRRKEHQKELLEKLIEERLIFYQNKQKEVKEEEEIKLSIIKESYLQRNGNVVCDKKYKSVCIPLGEYMVPFHISNIKNVVLVDDNILKINFTTVSNNLKKNFSSIKCLNLNDRRAREIYENIQNLKNEYLVGYEEIEGQEKILEKRKGILEDIYMRTDIKTPIKKRILCHLELYENGFRILGEKIDLLFNNIRHIFFQKGDVQHKTIIHFHLYKPILVNMKKTRNIQCYQETSGNLTYNTNKRGDEHMEFIMEKEEQVKQKRLNNSFEKFVYLIESETSFKVQRPRDGFYGVTHKESVNILKTYECLVTLQEQPFTIISMEDVEIVNFERVVYNVKTSDVIFIYKDLTTLSKILSIESSNMNKLKDYLDSNNVVYMETIFNIQWRNVLKKIMEDPISFYQTGGWTELIVSDEVSESTESTSTVEESESVEDSDDSTTSSEEDSDNSTTSSSDDMRKKRRK